MCVRYLPKPLKRVCSSARDKMLRARANDSSHLSPQLNHLSVFSRTRSTTNNNSLFDMEETIISSSSNTNNISFTESDILTLQRSYGEDIWTPRRKMRRKNAHRAQPTCTARQTSVTIMGKVYITETPSAVVSPCQLTCARPDSKHEPWMDPSL
ncbi:hypothetical protein N657DRAFT_310154 [Parathielavia appendiculata]|uniref:Uncharacterized protein n=1 Tax=Parathielavia appendiculata TaxID=2587402 RepID=A0AAN6Z5I8_9PEZI|nr:hypothetical protein N657DRAFT_310154 [Parathielavia appendiculata]